MLRSAFSILLFLFVMTSLWGQSPLNERTDFVAESLPLEDALIRLSEQTKINISFSNQLIPSDKVISIRRKNTTMRQLLDELLAETNIQYRLIEEQIVLSRKPPPPPQKYTISGYIIDAKTGEPLIGANVYVPDTQQGVTTNNYGFYSIKLTEGEVALYYSYLGYQVQKTELELKGNQQVNIDLKASLTLPEVTIIAADSIALPPSNIVSNVPQGLPINKIKELPSLGGEADIWRNTYLQSGVQTGTDGVGGLLVRGGSVDQNLVLLDGVAIYNPTHAIGIFSIFNTDVVKSANLYKGNFPARYGGRLSSVMDIRTREGYLKRFSGEASLGLIAARASIEGPIIKDKVSFFLSGRHSLTQWYIPELTRRVKDFNNRDLEEETSTSPDSLGRSGYSDYSFFDLNAKIHIKLSDKDKFYLSFYRGGDRFLDENKNSFQDSFLVNITPPIWQDATIKNVSQLGFSWGNTTAAFRWNHLWSDQLFSNTTINYSAYNFLSNDDFSSIGTYGNNTTDQILATQKFRLDIQNWTAKTDFEYSISSKQQLRFGLSASEQSFRPGIFFNNTEVTDVPLLVDSIAIFDTLDIVPQVAMEYDAYIEDELQISPWLSSNIGIRAAQWRIEQANYRSIQPRLNLVATFGKTWRLHTSYNRMVQHVHFLTKSNLGLPGDIWVPSTANVRPEQAWQTTFGLAYSNPKIANFSLEGYYKKMDHLITFVQNDSLVILSADDWEKNVVVGQGWSYGMEFSVAKENEDFLAQINYTLAWSQRQFDALNKGDSFPFRFDRRHSLKLIGQYFLNKRVTLNASWIFESGALLTLPKLSYPFRTPFGDIELEEPSTINGILTPYYHRLDIGLNYKIQKKKWLQTINFGIFNVYNRQNPIFYRVREDNKIVKVTLLPFLPSLSYSIQF